jgi:DNA-binding transcriptional LysR family regulator
VAGPLAANNSEALRDAALAGMGIALLPDFSAQAGLRDGQLRQVLAGWRNAGRCPAAVRDPPLFGPRARAVSALVQHLRQSLAGGLPAAGPSQVTPA